MTGLSAEGFDTSATDCGYITFDYLPVLSAPPFLPLCGCQQLHTANLLPMRCVCTCVHASMCLVESVSMCKDVISTLKAMLAVMCLMEDKQHSLRQAFTAKRFTPSTLSRWVKQ